ncbi:MAG: hypothetical protein ACREI9_15430 [Nitrospiraceae bacterium]
MTNQEYFDLRSNFLRAKVNWEKNTRPRLWAQGVRTAIYQVDDFGRVLEGWFDDLRGYLGIKSFDLAASPFLKIGTKIISFASIALLGAYIFRQAREYISLINSLSSRSIPLEIKSQIAERAFPPKKDADGIFDILGLQNLKISSTILFLLLALGLFFAFRR